MRGKGFVPAGELGVGTQIVTRAGPTLWVVGARLRSAKDGVTVYNLTVADDHAYFVGSAQGGVWVHNDCDGDYDAYYEVGVPTGSGSRQLDNAAANESLYNAMQNDPAFAQQLEQRFPGIGDHVAPDADGNFSTASPPGATWHHGLDYGGGFGSLQLVDEADHTGNPTVYHPFPFGGFWLWGRR